MVCCLQFTVWYCISPCPCAAALRSPVDASASQAITTQASWLSEVLQPLLLAQGSVLLQLFQLWGVLAALSGRKTQGGGGGGGRFKELWEQAGPTCRPDSLEPLILKDYLALIKGVYDPCDILGQ